MWAFSYKNDEFSFINFIIEQERKPGPVWLGETDRSPPNTSYNDASPCHLAHHNNLPHHQALQYFSGSPNHRQTSGGESRYVTACVGHCCSSCDGLLARLVMKHLVY